LTSLEYARRLAINTGTNGGEIFALTCGISNQSGKPVNRLSRLYTVVVHGCTGVRGMVAAG
jgi:hypothetical protein